ncbi:reverse transcriptase family protein [Deinococcus sp. HMF7604]|uniref:reverse transcriptase domain-containing protein n=1 Tax=Deinococcus betulae TaxID=2873312 RepID=UPI001CCF2593|nr:reverse transcriptase domain-containing protein [Deinococcus betulae]MBZ9752050.1 reverse transcriptase family protein [Deinococcus betulae]
MQTKDDLANALGISKSKLTYFAYAVSDKRKYVSFYVKKRSGGKRVIHAPNRGLKAIQRSLAILLSEIYQPSNPHCNHGFGRNRDIITNAQSHIGRRYLFKCDLKDFYPSINGARIFGVLTAAPFNFSDEVAHLIAMLSTKDGALPQGAPTSPVLSNIIIRKLDRKMMNFAKSSGGLYTRYADDITISYRTISMTRSAIDSDGNISDRLRHIIEHEDFTLNESKTRLLTKRNRQIVTGVVINEKLNVKRGYIRDLRNLIYILVRYGESDAVNAYNKHHLFDKSAKDIKRVIEGRIKFLERVRGREDAVVLKLIGMYQQHDKGFRTDKAPPYDDNKIETFKVRLLAEGKTDYKHLQIAFEFFAESNLYPSLDLNLEPHPDIEGIKHLEAHVKVLEKVTLEHLHIAIYDSDDKTINERYANGPKQLGSDLYGFTLPRPGHLPADQPFCIEMLYTPKDLTTPDENGRRIFLIDEFDRNTNHHKQDKRITTNNKSWDKLIIDDKVFRLDENHNIESINLSKAAFASFIEKRKTAGDPPDLHAFKAIFDMIDKIARTYYGKNTSELGEKIDIIKT